MAVNTYQVNTLIHCTGVIGEQGYSTYTLVGPIDESTRLEWCHNTNPSSPPHMYNVPISKQYVIHGNLGTPALRHPHPFRARHFHIPQRVLRRQLNDCLQRALLLYIRSHHLTLRPNPTNTTHTTCHTIHTTRYTRRGGTGGVE